MPKIAIIGRQNVGKSTFFNALIGKRKSIVFNKPGVTRDQVEHQVDWGFGKYIITDFPGLEAKKQVQDDILTSRAIEKALGSLEDYNLLLWVVSREGLTPYENELNKTLRKSGKLNWLVVNFVDDPALEAEASDFYTLGYERLFFISALNKRGINDLRNEIITHFGRNSPEEKNDTRPITSLAIIGKPNSGKSTLFNRLLAKEKALTSEIAGTTLDSLDDEFTYKNNIIQIIDTAGLRKSRRIDSHIERFSAERSHDAIKRADAVVLMVDPREGLDRQNRKILELAGLETRPLVMAVNKSDLLDEEQRKKLEYEIKGIQDQSWHFPVIFISSLSGKRVSNLLDLALKLVEYSRRKTSTSKLNGILEKIKNHNVLQRNRVKINYIAQAHPKKEFILFSNREKLPDNVFRFIEKELSKVLYEGQLPIILQNRRKNVSNRK